MNTNIFFSVPIKKLYIFCLQIPIGFSNHEKKNQTFGCSYIEVVKKKFIIFTAKNGLALNGISNLSYICWVTHSKLELDIWYGHHKAQHYLTNLQLCMR